MSEKYTTKIENEIEKEEDNIKKPDILPEITSKSTANRAHGPKISFGNNQLTQVFHCFSRLPFTTCFLKMTIIFEGKN